MRYEGKTALTKLKLENDKKEAAEKEDLTEVIEVSDEAAAVMNEIKKGFERLRLSNLTRR